MAGPVGRNKLAPFRHRDSAFAVGLPELRKLVPAYMLATSVKLHGASPWHLNVLFGTSMRAAFARIGDMKNLIRSNTKRAAALCIGLFMTLHAAETTAQYDIVIRGGTIVDGTGRPRFTGDVAIRAGRIVAVGQAKGKARQTIVAKGLVVSPGFIDLHSHADRGILEFRSAENYIRQGVTTLVCGNCGSSPVDLGAFFQGLRDGGAGVNVAMLIGHGSVRQMVIGRLNVPASVAHLKRMRQLVKQAMKDGAIGMSTSLRYGPGAYATTKEIVALAREVKPFGGFYATHMRDEGTRILEAIDEALLIGRQAGVPVHISHHKISSASVFGLTRLSLSRINAARSKGEDVTLDQYPYGAGSGGLGLYVPQASLSGGLVAYRDRISNPAQRAAIVAGVERLLIRKIYRAEQDPTNAGHTILALARIQFARAKHDPKLEGKTLVDILRGRNKKVTMRNGAELLVDLVAKGVRGINHTLDADPGGDVDRVMVHPQTAIASDGGVFKFGVGNPHPRSYGCFPRVLGHYVRKRQLLSLESAIQKMTQLPARRLKWRRRGIVRKDAWADLVVFDPATVSDKATFLKPHQHSVGIQHVLVRGQPVLLNGKMTGKLPGRPVGLTN